MMERIVVGNFPKGFPQNRVIVRDCRDIRVIRVQRNSSFRDKKLRAARRHVETSHGPRLSGICTRILYEVWYGMCCGLYSPCVSVNV